MGQAIVYCTRCNAQLRSTDFDKGSAVKIEHKTYCRKCLPDGVTPPPIEKLLSDSSTSRKRSNATASISIVPPKPAEPPKPILVWSGVAAGAVVLLAILVVFSRSDAPRAGSVPEPTADAPRPAPAPAPTPERDAREALARLQRRIAERPDDFDGQQGLLDDFAVRAKGTRVAGDVALERERLARRRQDRRRGELGELRLQIQDSTEDQSRILLNAARARYADAAWTSAIDELLKALAPAAPAPVVAAAAPKTPPPPTPVVAPPPPAPTFPPGWETALKNATARDYVAALAALDQSPDAPLVKAAAALQADALKLLARTARGQKVSLDAAGRHIEGAFLRENGGIFEIKEEAAVAEVDAGDISAASLVAVARAAGPVDSKTAAALCLIEGESEAAGSIPGLQKDALPERFWAYAKNVSRAATEPSREQYQEALAALAKPSTAADGVAKIQELLREHAGDSFVRRNRAAIVTRSQAGRDFVWFAEDLKSSGVFRPGKSGKLESCWTVENDVEGPKAKETFLEIEFSTIPETPYKAWALVGGCCQEVLEFSCQGTEMEAGKGTKESAEPGAGAAVIVKPWMSSLKKLHSQHNGPKSPARWDWTPLPLPRYAKAGVQKLRILSDQKGFSVAAVAVSATRPNPPGETELKEFAHGRGERPKPAPAAPKAIVLAGPALDGTDRHLFGEYRDRALYGISSWDLCFLGYERLNEPAVVFPAEAEFRFTYFIKIPCKLMARIRVEREGKTLPCDVEVPSPVVGKPTDVRIPISAFKPAYAGGAAIAPGETARMFYVFAPSMESGLRIDALSIVELKK